MPVPDWTKTEDWEVLYIAGKRVPGVSRVSVSMPSGIDTRKPKGAKKARQRDTGAPPAKVKCEVELLPEELPQFEADIVPLLRPRSLFAPRDPVDISHPEARLWGINVGICGEIESQYPRPGGSKVVTFTVEEWAPEPLNLKGTGSSKPKNHDDEEDWDVQKYIDRLRPARSGAAAANF